MGADRGIEIPDEAWQEAGGDEHPWARLYTNMSINGRHFHVEAIAVKYTGPGEYMEAAVPDFDNEFDGICAIGGGDYCPGADEIRGRPYVIVVTPHGR